MDSIFSSSARSCLRKAVRSATEAAALAAVAAAAIGWKLDGEQQYLAWAGLCAAWLATSMSTAYLIFKKEASFEIFLKAFGAGVLLRALVLAAMIAATWGRPWGVQAPLLGAYALGITFLLLVEYRHLAKQAK